jgi:hypothetical protein
LIFPAGLFVEVVRYQNIHRKNSGQGPQPIVRNLASHEAKISGEVVSHVVRFRRFLPPALYRRGT